jgi:hypothetical protein
MKDLVWRRIGDRGVRPDLVVPALEPRLAELGALVADRVLRCAFSAPCRLVRHKADLVVRRTPPKNSKADRAAGPVVDDDGNPPAAKEKGSQVVQKPALVGTALVSRPQTWFG